MLNKKIVNFFITVLFMLSAINAPQINAIGQTGVTFTAIPTTLENITQEIKDKIIQEYFSQKQTESAIKIANLAYEKKIKIIKIALTGAATLFVAHICLKIYITYRDGQEMYKLLKEFNSNPNYTYENLAKDARNLYYKQSINPSSLSLSNDYPISGYLEKKATEIKNFLGAFFFCNCLIDLSKKLEKELKIIRENGLFQKERKEFNDKYRQQAHRNFIALTPVS